MGSELHIKQRARWVYESGRIVRALSRGIFVLPMLLHKWYIALGVYALAAFVSGVVLSIVFQLAHVVGEADFPVVAVDTQDLDIDFLAHLEGLFGLVDLLVGDFGDMEQAFQPRFEFHEDAEVGDLRDMALDDHARPVVGGNDGLPGVFLHLFQT